MYILRLPDSKPIYDDGTVVSVVDQDHARVQKVLSEGNQHDNVFFVFFLFVCCFFSLMRGGRTQIPRLAGLQRPASEMPFKWRFVSGPMMAQH